MAGKNRPSFLKRQKEQKRLAKAAEKREARRLKKSGNATAGDKGDDFGSLDDIMGPGDVDAETSGEANDESDEGGDR
jgi:hypothetical protein